MNIIFVDNLICEAIDELRKKGHWLESGTMNLNNELWSYKIQKLKQKPKPLPDDFVEKQS